MYAYSELSMIQGPTIASCPHDQGEIFYAWCEAIPPDGHWLERRSFWLMSDGSWSDTGISHHGATWHFKSHAFARVMLKGSLMGLIVYRNTQTIERSARA